MQTLPATFIMKSHAIRPEISLHKYVIYDSAYNEIEEVLWFPHEAANSSLTAISPMQLWSHKYATITK